MLFTVDTDTPFISKLFYFFAFLSLVGTLYITNMVWPDAYGYGAKDYSIVGYVLGFGFVEIALFLGFGVGLKCLSDIRYYHVKNSHALADLTSRS